MTALRIACPCCSGTGTVPAVDAMLAELTPVSSMAVRYMLDHAHTRRYIRSVELASYVYANCVDGGPINYPQTLSNALSSARPVLRRYGWNIEVLARPGGGRRMVRL